MGDCMTVASPFPAAATLLGGSGCVLRDRWNQGSMAGLRRGERPMPRGKQRPARRADSTVGGRVGVFGVHLRE